MDLDAAIDGTWWLPETPAATVRGVLETDDNGMFVLRTTKPAAPPGTGSVAWDNDDDDDPYVMPFRPMLHGRSTAGVAVTLIGCHCVRRSIPLGGPASGEEAWRVEAIVLGCWLDAPDELMSEVRVELGSLFEWAHGPGPAVSVTADRDQTTVTGRAAILGLAKIDGATLTLRSDHYVGYDRSSATLNQLVRLVFEPKKGIPLRSAMDELVFPVRDLLALMTADYVAVRSVEAHPAVVVEAAQSVQVRYLAPLQRPYRRRQPREAHEMLATLANLDIPFEQLLPSWFHLRERHLTAVAMLLIPTHAPYLYADSQLLTAWLALEAYHDVAIGGTAVPADKHKARVDAIVSAAPPEHREWARDMLGGKNQIGAKRQLGEIIKRAGATGASITTAKANFVKVAVAGRQKVAHPTLVTGEAGAELVFLGSAIRWLLRHCLLEDLGVDHDRVAQLISSSQDFALALEELASL